ncbi:amidase [Streptoalloteichus tenebrarius]|uniref:Amidase n=1 Tax=Streptoalloteichus tenebrarius (strain ATCC 17920 / DSM 40477 / JCM 4838 / CBS 697.72 / NBRC 16177 / NCIMB 11028 / NRRL B-12390 / A12253. 1 / ISP 5477) TaxID=1933 RepID=A0ABT1HWF4_STRSD|nr:amidase [Streptoalloteichus tenebrarius]MCP2259853.1 amidase [Streptoalloteichus tenebrarius]
MSAETRLVFRTARELVTLMATRQVSAREVLDAHLAQIEKVNPEVNAIVTLTPERAYELASRADDAIAHGRLLGPLHGLPVAHKDLASTAGIRTTFGSLVFKDNVPQHNDLHVQRLLDAGAVTVGKTNTPEFGNGSQTFNKVFGATRNPYDITRTCGGSSGGAAVALATGMVPIADGSDMAGSLRNPASFCNVVGLRPSIGRVPFWPTTNDHFTLPALGAMARTVGDLALQMSVLARPTRRCPVSAPPVDFTRPVERDVRGVRVAWSVDLGGLPVEPAVVEAMAPARDLLVDLGCEVVDACPDFTGADEAFTVLRALAQAFAYGPLVDEHGDLLSDNVRWEVAKGRTLTATDLERAATLRTALYNRVLDFFGSHQYLVTLVSQVVPFDVDLPYPTEINGTPMTYYREWMRSCSWLTTAGVPCLSVPFAFTRDGLPVGVQVVGAPGDDLGVLALGHAIEAATRTWQRHPALAE